jgi:hypothetical protein
MQGLPARQAASRAGAGQTSLFQNPVFWNDLNNGGGFNPDRLLNRLKIKKGYP